VFDFFLASTPNFSMDSSFILFNFVMLIGVFVPKYLHKLAELGLFTIFKKEV
jgi:hypothetical protein